MKSSAGIIFAFVLLLVLGAFEIWQYREQQIYRESMQHQLVELSARLEGIELTVNQAKEQMRELEGASIGGLIDNANDALIEGWSAMMDAVGRELDSARKTFEQKRQALGGADKPAPEEQATPNQSEQKTEQAGEGPL
jgi:hypothetical protein